MDGRTENFKWNFYSVVLFLVTECFRFILVGVNSNLCFIIFIYWWYRPLPLLGRIDALLKEDSKHISVFMKDLI